MLYSVSCDKSDTYKAVKVTITVRNNGTAAATNKRNKEVLFKNFAPFTNCLNEINNTQIDSAKDIDVVTTLCSSCNFTKENVKLLDQLKSGFKRTIN